MNRALNDCEKVMVAAARLAARYVDAAVRAGADESEITEGLRGVASGLGNMEFWVTDENGRIAIGCRPLDFQFPESPRAGTQSAAFVGLLDGTDTMVVQDPQPREIDGKVFQYVGVAGIDRPRIVQIGVAADES